MLSLGVRILLTNDDGIRAPGIEAMHEALLEWGRSSATPLEVFTVAPQTVQSASAHGVTFHTPIMIREERVSPTMVGVAVDARPADCVKLAISNIWPEKHGRGSRPDLVISGLNSGANCGINVIYSGTVAAALEAAFLGVPSIAMSLMLGSGRPRYDVAARWACKAVEGLMSVGKMRAHECVSVNVPPVEEDGGVARLPGVVVCPMNTHGLVDQYERRVSPIGEVYYWAAGHGLDFHGTEKGTDVDHLLQGRITVTPLMYDLTRHGMLEDMRVRLGTK